MDSADRAIGILVEAEDALGALMREGLEQQRYDDVAAVAEIAQRFSDFIRSLEGPVREAEQRETRRKRKSKRRRTAKSRQAGSKPPIAAQRDAYPKFRRDGDRLVKVGWSRKGRKEYEQRAPIEVVWTFVRVLGERDDRGAAFVMDEVLPLKNETGEEYPSYQSYMALAWLRSVDVVSKNGRDGYQPDASKLDEEHMRGLWENLRRLGSESS